jgi:transposase
MAILTVGDETAKSVLAAHGIDATGTVPLRQPKVARAKLLALVNALPPFTIDIEACSGAHHWARHIRAQGHRVKLMALTRQRICGPQSQTG